MGTGSSYGLVVLVLSSLCWQLCYANEPCQCVFHKNPSSSDVLKKLIEPLCGKRYNAEDDDYAFEVGICTSATQTPESDELKKTAGVLQTKKKDNSQHVLGSFKNAEIMSGTNWILMEYEGGDNYGHSCGSEKRRSNIMITCNPSETVGRMRYIEENHNKSDDCYYLFELEHSIACSPVNVKGLSAGSTICIVIACFAGVYLIGGFLFMRLCRRAKGLHQIPNYSFWRDFGALQADGCDLVCRCGSRSVESKGNYHGIGDHQIECAEDSEDFDEHLLPM